MMEPLGAAAQDAAVRDVGQSHRTQVPIPVEATLAAETQGVVAAEAVAVADVVAAAAVANQI